MSWSRTFRIRRGKSSSNLRNRRRLAVEILEIRQLLATDTWTNPSGGSWDVASNWSNGVPSSTDDVVINLSGSPTVTISSNVESVHSITATDPLVISGGGLEVAATSTISGGLTMTGGALTADGSMFTLTVTGTTTASGASLTAEGGATLSMPNLTSYQGYRLLNAGSDRGQEPIGHQ